MKEDYLLENEEKTHLGKNTYITNYRVWHQDNFGGKMHFVSILLKNISSIEVHYQNKKLLLLLGIVFIIAGLMCGFGVGELGLSLIGTIPGIIFIVLYFLSRKHVITISSNGGSKIDIYTSGLSRDSIFKFVNSVETSILNLK